MNSLQAGESPVYNPELVERITSSSQVLDVVTFEKMTTFAQATLPEHIKTPGFIAKTLRHNYLNGYGVKLIDPYLYVREEPEGFMADNLDEFLKRVSLNSQIYPRVENQFRVRGFQKGFVAFLSEVNQSLVKVA